MPMTKGQINREGVISFHDASLSIWEEGLNAHMTAEERNAWKLTFKRQVFARVVQALNRLGWTCVVPEEYIKQYSRSFARDRRRCHKGDLKGWLEISGCHIKFEMWQSVNTPTRPDHGGRYEADKEGCMPYVLWLEMERTRRRIRDYLCNVFTGYTISTHRPSKRATAETAMESIARRYAESWHFKGDMAEYLKKNNYAGLPDYNCKSGDGARIEHGQHVYFKDWHGRICSGTALYNINNMWWVVTGKYDYTNIACFDIFTNCPEKPWIKRNQRQRRKRLEQELNKAVAAMDFKRAEVLKAILFPTGPLYAIWSKKEQSYFAIMYCGYRRSLAEAGKYTREELKPYFGTRLETDTLKAVPLEMAA